MMMLFFVEVEELFGVLFFFFQAEDGIRDATVTGVQTCALPILGMLRPHRGQRPEDDEIEGALEELDAWGLFTGHRSGGFDSTLSLLALGCQVETGREEDFYWIRDRTGTFGG